MGTDNGQAADATEPQTINPAAAGDAANQGDQNSADQPAAHDDADDSGANPGKSKGVQKRIDELVRLREEAKRDADHWRQVAERMMDRGDSTANQQKQDAPKSPAPGQPKPEQFATYEEYVDAVTDWKLEQRELALRTAAEKREQAAREADFEAKAKKVIGDGEAEYPDFREVVSVAAITKDMAEALADSSHAHRIAYHLGMNPDESRRIASLAPRQQAMEIARLEARIERDTTPQAPKKTVPGAPPPVDPVKSQSRDSNPGSMSMAEYAEWRARKRK